MFLALFVLAAVGVSGFHPLQAQQLFSDVPPSSPYYHTANRMKQLGITSGCNNGADFCPDQPLLRSHIAVFIIRAIYGGDSFSYTQSPYFDDVFTEDFYFPHVQKMKDLGITGGCGYRLYCPWDNTQNVQVAAFTIRGAQRKQSNPLFLSDQPEVPLDNAFETHSTSPWFDDVNPSGMWWEWFRFVQKVRDLGYINTGCAGNNFCPGNHATRGDITYYIVRGILDEFPPPNGLSSSVNPVLAANAKLQGNAGFVPFDSYQSQNNGLIMAGCTNRLTVRECVQRYVANLKRQGVTDLRFFFGLMGGGGSTAMDQFGTVSSTWLSNVGLFFQDLKAAGITHVWLNPSLWGLSDDPILSASVTPCDSSTPVTRYFWRTAPHAFVPLGNGYKPDNEFLDTFFQNSYNCSPPNPYFVGWDKLYNLMDLVVKRAKMHQVAVSGIEILAEMNLQDFSIQARFIWDNKHGADIACEVGGAWQDSRKVLECFRRVMTINGFSEDGVTISVPESRTTGVEGTDCLSVYGDQARVIGLSGLNAAVAGGGRIGRASPEFVPTGLECHVGGLDGRETLPYGAQPTPGAIALHSYVCVAKDAFDHNCDLTKSGAAIADEFKKLSNAIALFRTNRWPNAKVFIGETLNNDSLNVPGSRGQVQCLNIPLSAPVDMVTGFNQSSLAGQQVVFRPFAILQPDRTCVPWPPLWNKGNGPFATQ